MNLTFPKKYSLVKDGITQSLLATYIQCPKKFLYSINLWAEPEKKSTQFGSFFHHILETIYSEKICQQKNLSAAITICIDAYQFPKVIKTDEAEYMRAVASVLAPFYFKLYAKDFDYEITTEYKFEAPLGNLAKLRGMVDGIFGTPDTGDYILLETKTKSQIPEERIEGKLSLDWQTLFYSMAARIIFGKPPKKIIYNVVRYPQRKIKTTVQDFCAELLKDVTAKPDYYFMRWETSFTNMELDKFQEEISSYIMDISTDTKFRRNLSACDSLYPCPYIQACITGKPEGLRKKKVLFEELA
jgi:hypothetical protein